MFENAIKIPSKINSKILLKVVPGHFATSHSHINYYMDMTRLKVGQREAKPWLPPWQTITNTILRSMRSSAWTEPMSSVLILLRF